jgi:hypothetical protein
MTAPARPGPISRKEHAARAAAGMPAGHPGLITRKPRRAEWKQLATWLAELWPHDEYTAIAATTRRPDWAPGTEGEK